jgi:uncharacterized protein (TIGR02757 family)
LYTELINTYNNLKYFTTDPVAVVRMCKEKADIEIMAVVCSWLAYGNRQQIFKKCNFAYTLMNGKPYNYLLSKDWQQYKTDNNSFYRLFKFSDFYNLMNSLYSIYTKYNDLESYINDFTNKNTEADYLDALIAAMKANGIPKDKKSACKRLCLMLRWLIRDDNNVDLGIWKSLSKTKLYIPLDVHVNRVSRQLGLLKRNASDFKAVQELTENCRKYYPEDPTIMDFALFGSGFTEKNEELGIRN